MDRKGAYCRRIVIEKLGAIVNEPVFWMEMNSKRWG